MTRHPNTVRGWAIHAILLVGLLGACGGPPRPGQAGYPYNLRGVYAGRLLVEGEPFDAEVQLSTALGGGVRGSFRVREPLDIDGRIEGAVMDNLVRMVVTYRGAEGTDCDGRIEAILTVAPGGDALEGPATIFDCGDALPGQMSFGR